MTLGARAGAWFDTAVRRWLAVPRPLRWLPVAVLVALLWWSSSTPPRPTEPSIVGAFVHNAMHVVAYAIVAAAVWCAAHAPGSGDQRRAAAVAIAFAIGYGVVDELHQSHVPGRVASAWDVGSDACGALLAVWLLHRRFAAPRVGLVHGACVLAASCVSVAFATFW